MSRQPFVSRADQKPESRRSVPGTGPLRRGPLSNYWLRAVCVGAAPSGPAAATSEFKKMVICTINPGRSSPVGFSNSARIRTAVSATGWIWGSTKVILPRNRFFSIGQGLALALGDPRLDLDDLPLLDPKREVERNVGVGAELVEVAELDDRLVGTHALARVLHPLDDDPVERGDDRVLLEGLFGQVQLGLGDRPGFPRLR